MVPNSKSGFKILTIFYFFFEGQNKLIFIIRIPNLGVRSTFEDPNDLTILKRHDDLTNLND